MTKTSMERLKTIKEWAIEPNWSYSLDQFGESDRGQTLPYSRDAMGKRRHLDPDPWSPTRHCWMQLMPSGSSPYSIPTVHSWPAGLDGSQRHSPEIHLKKKLVPKFICPYVIESIISPSGNSVQEHLCRVWVGSPKVKMGDTSKGSTERQSLDPVEFPDPD